MQLVIDIPEEQYITLNAKSQEEVLTVIDVSLLIKAIKNGISLPAGHGRLIDADYLRNVILLHNFHGNNKYIVPYSDRRGYRLRQREVDESIINATTIIEADKAESEK